MDGLTTFTGPLFDGRAELAAAEGTENVRMRLAAEAERLTIAAFAGQIRNGTGTFLGSVTQTSTSREYSTTSGGRTYTMPVVVADMATDIVVTTDLASYGPWLEGTGSRNESTSFKGYHGFRQASQELASSSGATAEQALAPYIGRMN
jgi:hypothetical protein